MMLANTANMLTDLKMMTDVMVDFVNADDRTVALSRIMSLVLPPDTCNSITVTKLILFQMTAFPLGAIFQFNCIDNVMVSNYPKKSECMEVLNLLVIDGELTGSIYGL